MKYHDSRCSVKPLFRFIVKLDKNKNADGNLDFQYITADINLKSQVMTWCTTSNNKALFQGEATINGAELYTFKVIATDGDLTGDPLIILILKSGRAPTRKVIRITKPRMTLPEEVS